MSRQLTIPVLDTAEADLLSWLPESVEFIRSCLEPAEGDKDKEADERPAGLEPVKNPILVHW